MDANYQVETDQVFEDDRSGTEYSVIFENSDVVLLRYDRNHRMETREAFEKNIHSGRFKPRGMEKESLRTNTEAQEQTEKANTGGIEERDGEVPLMDLDYIGEVGKNSLHEAGLVTERDFSTASDSKILSCDGIGKIALNNIREYIEQ